MDNTHIHMTLHTYISPSYQSIRTRTLRPVSLVLTLNPYICTNTRTCTHKHTRECTSVYTRHITYNAQAHNTHTCSQNTCGQSRVSSLRPWIMKVFHVLLSVCARNHSAYVHTSTQHKHYTHTHLAVGLACLLFGHGVVDAMNVFHLLRIGYVCTRPFK